VWRNVYSGVFDLTIRNITRPVTINFTVAHGQNSTRYHGTFTVNRVDFGLGEASAILDENVEITLEAVEND
jgi:polyisoprenoid-binding protein YceI